MVRITAFKGLKMQIYTCKKLCVTSFLLFVLAISVFLAPITASQQGSNPSSAAKKYECDWPGCRKSFAAQNNLRRHRKTHTGEQPYACGRCGKKFTRKDNLERHKITHIEEQPYACGRCEKKFTRKDSLNNHLKKIHIDTSNPTNDFELVRALKKINQAIVNHKLKMDEETRKSMPSLTPEIEQELLQMAKEIEEEEKLESHPHKCTWPGCGKSYSFKFNLTRHKEIHTRKTLYECNVL